MKFNKVIKLTMLATCITSAVFAMNNKKTQGDLKVMTFNIRREGSENAPEREWENRQKAVVSMLQTQKPAIFGVQEATLQQIADLKDGLKGYDVFGKGRGTSWGGRGTDEFTPIFYDQNKLEKIEEDTFDLNPEFRSWSSFFRNVKEVGVLPRICTYALFKDKQTDKLFCVFNTHLDHMFNAARVKQIKVILDKIKQVIFKQMIAKQVVSKQLLDKTEIPVILMGDFNTNLTGQIADELRKNGFVNTKTKAQEKTGPTVTQEGWSGKDNKIIDHILLQHGESVLVKKHSVLKPENGTIWSDHYPVIVDLLMNQKSKKDDSLKEVVVEK